MKVFAISDLHLSINNPKPMDIFGPIWDDYLHKIVDSWNQKVGIDDVVLIGGDISWAMTLDKAIADLNFIAGLPGKKIMIKGNHDYWWSSISRIRAVLAPDFFALQNDCVKISDVLFCGSRGWSAEIESSEDQKIFDRELIRMRLSLETAQKKQNANDKIIVLMHYPPFNCKLEDSRFTALFDEFGVNKVIYGHLHGKNIRPVPRLIKNKTEYILTSCDQVDNTLVDILL